MYIQLNKDLKAKNRIGNKTVESLIINKYKKAHLGSTH